MAPRPKIVLVGTISLVVVTVWICVGGGMTASAVPHNMTTNSLRLWCFLVVD